MTKKYIISNDFLGFVTTYSPYLKKLSKNFYNIIQEINVSGWNKAFARIIRRLDNLDPNTASKDEVMATLRIAKSEISLLIALADISEEWDLVKTTNSLSKFADLAIAKSLQFVIADRAKNKQLKSSNIEDSGIFIIAAGKML